MLLAASLVGLLSPKFPMTVESIMRGPALVGHAPRNLSWTSDGSAVSFSWAKADGSGDPDYKQYHVKRDGTGLTSGPAVESAPAPPTPTAPAVEKLAVLVEKDDLYLYDPATKTTKRLTQTAETKSDPKLVDAGQSVVYFVGLNLYRLKVADGTVTQLTDVRTADKAPSTTPAGPKTTVIQVPRGYRASPLTLSPNGDHAYIQFTEEVPRGRTAEVPRYVTSSGYPDMISTYQRPGTPRAQSKGLIVDLESGATMDVTPARPARALGLRWSSDGEHAFLVERALDHKDDWIMGFDAKSDRLSQLWDEHCDAWVGGPGRGAIGWYPDGSRIYFVSEQSGFSSLYTVAPTGGDPVPLVRGNFEVSEVRLDAPRSRFTFVSSEGGPSIRHLDTIGLDGTSRRQLATLSADEDSTYSIAPNGEEVAVVRSSSNRPAELFVNKVQVTTTPTEEWLAGPWIDPAVVMVPSTDGVLVPSRLFRSAHFHRGGPAVIFVHGAGYLQNVYAGWSHYFREYMFEHVLMDHGYAVLDMDYRGSAGYGRDWRTAIYRHMGGKDLDDEVAGAKWLVDHEGVAKDRLGIYGGSYGGFLTLMAMFTRPGVFAAGAALRPVADWASYDDGYTTEILNEPQDDKEAYRVSSPINFVDGLQGALLICHGMVDTNVAFQDSVRVTEKLIELGKTNWEIAPYPLEDHGFTKPSSWTDEYRRILDLFERTIGSQRKRG
jgi:dipeptidyl aminopeptidase/acylaminoacyl peptidase